VTEPTVTETPARESRKADVALIMMGLMAFSMGQTMIFAIAGPATRLMGLAETDLGLIVSLAAVSYTIAVPIWGRVSDRIGRIAVIYIGLIAYALATFAFAYVMHLGMTGVLLAPISLILLIGIRMSLTIGSGGVHPGSTAFMADITESSKRAAGVAMVGAAFGLGAVVGPVLAGFLSVYGLLFPLYASAVAAGVLGIIIAIKVPEPHRAKSENASGMPILDSRIRSFFMLGIIAFTTIAIIQQTSAFYFMDRFDLSPEATARNVGISVGCMSLTMMAVQAGLIQVWKISPKNMLIIGFAATAIGLVLVLWAPSLAFTYAAYAVIGIGGGLINPGLLAGASLRVGADHQGAVAGVVAAGMGAGYIVGPLLGTYLFSLNLFYPFAFAAALSLVSVLAALLLKTQPSRS
jgi:MFS transporter, DHA1 family, multidrug resistance protein